MVRIRRDVNRGIHELHRGVSHSIVGDSHHTSNIPISSVSRPRRNYGIILSQSKRPAPPINQAILAQPRTSVPPRGRISLSGHSLPLGCSEPSQKRVSRGRYVGAKISSYSLGILIGTLVDIYEVGMSS